MANMEFNDVQLDVTFTTASNRANVATGENIADSFGKIAKWYEALVPTGGSSGQFLGFNSSGTAKWVSNPNVDEKVKSTKISQSTAAASYYPTLMSGETTAGVGIIDSAKINHTPGTTSVVGNTRLVLGNAINEGTTNNEEGLLRLYSAGTKYHTIKGAKITTDNVEHILPTTGGTILNTGTTSFTQTLSSGTKIGSIKINGTSTDIYAPTDTDTKVTQSSSTTSDFRPLLLGKNNQTNPENLETTVTDQTYVTKHVFVQPSTGNLTLYNASGDSPSLIFRRGTMIDNTLEWRIQNVGGKLNFDRDKNESTETWENIFQLDPSNNKLYFKNTEVSLSGHTHNYVPNTQTGMNAAINLLATGSSDPQLADYYISQYAGGGTTTTTYHRRPISALWNTFKALITVGTTGTGNAVTSVSIGNDGNNRKITFTKGSTFLTSHQSVTDGNPTLSWGNQSTVATIGSTDIHVTMPANPNTDTKVTSTANHYTPETVSGKDKTASASGATAAWSIDVVKGVTLNTDGKGHVTGMSVTSGKIPTNPIPSYNVTGSAAWTTADRILVTNAASGNVIKQSSYTIATSVPANALFTDTWTAMVGATSSANGSVGYVNAVPPKDGYNTKFLRADGSWAVPANTTYSAGTGLSLSGTTINHSNSVTARTDYNAAYVKFDAQGHITAASYFVHTAKGTDNTAGWVKIATMVHTGTYDNTPIMLTVNQRGDTLTYRIHIQFNNENSKDPALERFIIASDNLWESITPRAIMKKTATSTWDLYIQKKDNYDAICITSFDVGGYFSSKMTWTWSDVHVNDEPTDGTEATKKVYSTTDHTHSYAGSSSAGGAATSANKLNTNAGSATRPVYFSGGIPVVTTAPASGAWFSSFTGSISSSGVLEVGRYLDFHSSNTGTTDYDVRIDVSDTSQMTLTSNSGTPRFKIKGTEPTLNFAQTTTDKVYDNAYVGIKAYPGDTSGLALVMQSGGMTMITSGEAGSNGYPRMISTSNAADDTSRNPYLVSGFLTTPWIGASEVLILSSDNAIYFQTNMPNSQTVPTDWDNLKTICIDTSGNFKPTVNKKGQLGTASLMWNAIYGNTIYENGTSLANKYAGISHTHTTTIATDSGTSQLTLSANTKYKLTAGGTEFIFTTPTDNDTKVTSSANHYTPSTASGQDKSASASGATAAWSIDVVKGVTLNTDGKGHVTGISVTSGKIPANPNTDTKVNVTLATTSKAYLLATTTTPTSTAAAVTSVADTGVYLGTTAGSLCTTGGITSNGDIVLHNSNTTDSPPSPALIFQRGTTSDSVYDWKEYVDAGHFKFDRNNAGTWTTLVYFEKTGKMYVTGDIYSNNTKVSLEGHTHDYSKVTASSTNGKIKIDGTDTTVYTHPSYTSKTSGLYKITVDALGHVSATASVAKGDIPALDYLPSTTKYAGSSSVGGAATSADKLTTARTITLGNDFQGSASFNGSANITISGAHYRTGSSGQNTANYPWHRIAYCSGKSGKFSDTDAVIDIWKTYDGGGYGRIKISLRTNAAGAACSASAKWIYRYGFAIDDIKVARWGVTGESVYVDVFLKCETYPRANIVQIHGNRAWTLVSSNEVSNTTSSDKKDSVEVYATIESAGTELHNQAYTEIKSAEDAAYTRGVTIPRTGSSTDANSFAGKNLVVFNEWNGTSTNNTPTAHYYHILRAQGNDTKYGTQLALGMNTNGIYYRNYNNENWLDWQALGRFTATPTSGRVVVTDGTTGGIKSSAYTIAKSVPSDAVFTDTVTTVTTSGSGNAVTSITASNGALTVTKGSTFSLDGHDNKCTVTNGSATSTNYGIVFVVNPNTTENNTLRKTNDFRYQMKNGSANTEGFASIVLGNTKKLSEADNKSGNIYLYSSGGYYHLINTTSTTSNVTHTLPATAGTILNSGTTSFTQSVSSGTKIGSIKINGTSTDIYTDNKVKQGNTATGNYRPVMLGTTNNSDPSTLNVDVTGQAYVTTSIYAKPVDGILYANTFTGDLSGNASSATQVYGTLTNPTTSTNYPIPFHTGASSANKSLLNNNGLSYTTLEGTASEVGYGILCVGNKTDSGTAGNKYGIVRIYPKTGAKYGQLKVADTMTGDRTYTLPDKTGTVAMTSDTQFLKTGISYDDSSTLTSKPWHKFAEVTISVANTDDTITFMVSKTWGSTTSCAGILSAHLRTGSTKVHDASNTQFQWNVVNEGIDPSNFVMVIIDTASTSSKVELWCKYEARYDGWIFSVIKDHSRKARTTSWTVFSTSTAGSATYTTGTTNPIVSSLPSMRASTFIGEITTLAFLNRIYALSQTPSGSTWNGNETLITSIPSASGTSTPNYRRVKTIDFVKDCISSLKEPVLYDNTINPPTSTTINLPNGIPKYLKVFIGAEYSSDGSTYNDTTACINCIDVDMAHSHHGGFIGYDTPGPSGVTNYLAYCYVNVTQNTGSTTAYTVGISYASFLNLATSTTIQNVIARIVKIIAVY